MVSMYFLPCVMNCFNLIVENRKGRGVGGEKLKMMWKYLGMSFFSFCCSYAAFLGCLA